MAWNHNIVMVEQVASLKMHPKPNHMLLFLLAIYFLCFLCGNAEQGRDGNCSKQFQCGNLPNVSYPFWGGSQPWYCGHESFQLNCQDDSPRLNISSLSYRVQKINMSAQTLVVVREDLVDLEHHCPRPLRNTTWDSQLFTFPSDVHYKNITLFFYCTNDQPQQETKQFSCDAGGVKTIGFLETGDASSGPGPNIRCKSSIYVPVGYEDSQVMKAKQLKYALELGFSIQWLDYVNSSSFSTRPCNYNNVCGRPGRDEDTADTAVDEAPGLSPGAADENEAKGRGTNSGQSKRTKAIGITLGVTIGATVLIVVIVFPCLTRRCALCKSHQRSNQDFEKCILQHGSLALQRYKYSEIKKITKSFSDKLGQGGYGSVYKGMLPDGCLVAVKVLIETGDDGEEFINEVASISRTSHVNIVTLLGFCHDRNKRALIYEFMANKSLDKFISNLGSQDVTCHLDLETLYEIAIGVAKGLDYLHTSCSTKIVHFDIKPQNILLDEDFCPKISDFGLAKLCKKRQSILSMIGARGTIGYIAPEIISRHVGGVSHKADVYSYGMMVFEMVEARKNFGTGTIRSSENYFPERIYEHAKLDVSKKLEDGTDENEEEKARKLLLVGLWCIQTTPSDRPSMCKVLEMLEGSLQTIQIPPKPALFSPSLSGPELSPSLSAYVDTEYSTRG